MKCLKIQPDNAKALYRRGMGYLGNNNLLKAEADLQEAQSLAGNGKKRPILTIVYNFLFNNRSKHQATVSVSQIKTKELRTRAKENVYKYVFQIN